MTTTSVALLPVDPSGPAAAAAIADLRDALDRVRAHVLAGSLTLLSDAAGAEATVKLQRAEDITAACAAVALVRTAGCGYAQGEGFVMPATWVRVRTNISQGPTAGVDRIGQKYAAKVKCVAIQAGAPLTPIQIAAAVAEARPGFEATFLDLGQRYSPDTVRQGMAHALERVDPEGTGKAAMDAFDAQTLSMNHVGDMAVIAVHSTREIAAALGTVLDHFRGVRHHSGVDTPSPEAGDLVDPVMGTTPVAHQDQLDAVAFADWVTATLDNGLGAGKQTERPHLDLLVTLTKLQTQTGSGQTTSTGIPLPAVSIARIACDADITLLTTTGINRDPQNGEIIEPILAKLIGAPAEIVDYGRTQRIVPDRLRRVLTHRDRGCAFPHCHRVARHTQAHHVQHSAAGGLSDVDNCVLLCSRHHHLVHKGGWRIRPRTGMVPTQPGYWEFLAPAASPDCRSRR